MTMRRADRSLAMVTVVVLIAAAGFGLTIHLRARAWEPDFGARRPGFTDSPDAQAESGVTSSPRAGGPEASLVQRRRQPTVAKQLPAVAREPRKPPIAQGRPVARARGIPRPTIVESPPSNVEVAVPAARPDTGITSSEAAPPPRIPGQTYTVRISALRSLTQATDIAGRLARYGYRAIVETLVSSEAATYLAVSEPLPRLTAEKRALALAAVGIATTVHERDRERVQLVFGRFHNAEDSDAAARRVRQRGYTALTLVEGGTTYVVHVGPHEKAQVNEVAALLAGGLYVVDVEPVP